MDSKKVSPNQIAEQLFSRYPALEQCRESFMQAYDALVDTYRRGGKLLLAGNGGSAADSDHISGEITKSFMFKRALDPELLGNLESLYGEDGIELSGNLEGGLPAIPLTVFNAANSAFNNDVAPEAAYAQLVQVFGRKEDTFLGITTSGNSRNIILSFMAARARGMKTIALTGSTGGKSVDYADICIRVPEKETFKIQELHLPVYHALCAMVESTFFNERA